MGIHLLNNIRPHTLNLGDPLAKHLVSMFLMVTATSPQPLNNKGAPNNGPYSYVSDLGVLEPPTHLWKDLVQKRKPLINEQTTV